MLKKWMLIALSFISFLLCACVVIIVYGQATTLPKGVNIPLLEWDVAGMELEHFREQLPLQAAALAQQKIEIKVEVNGASKLDGADGAVGAIGAGGADRADRSNRAISADVLSDVQTFSLEQLGFIIDWSKALQQAETMLSGTIWQRAVKRWTFRHEAMRLSYDFDSEVLAEAIAERWPSLQSAQPVNAERIITAADQVTYRAGTSVIHIDVTRLRSMLIDWVGILNRNGDSKSDSDNDNDSESEITPITAPLQTIHPTVTMESLVQQGVDRKIVEFTTHFRTSGAGRVHNIQATAATIHDRLMAPGELFDFGEVVRATEQNAGYKQAPVIVNGKFVPGIGGGICQVSSTLYNAVLRGGFEIVERKNHSLPVRYIPLGQDATFSSGHINFKFRNHLDSYTLIRIETSNDHITVKLFSSLPDGVTYDIQSTIVKTIDPPQKFVHNPNLKKGTTKLLRKGQAGYVVDTYRTMKKDGKAIHTEKISEDHYHAQPSLIATHPQNQIQKKPNHQPSPKKQIIEDGVSGPVFNSLTEEAYKVEDVYAVE